MKAISIALILVFSLVKIGTAEAKFGKEAYLLDLSLYYTSEKNAQTTTTTTPGSVKPDVTMLYDINAGKVTDKGYYFGAIYSSRSQTLGGTAVGEGGTAMGLSGGLFNENGYFVIAHYLISASNGTYSNGSGIQGEVGFKTSLNSDWLLGANVSYRSITYKKTMVADPTFVSLEVTEIFPMISVGYLF